MWPFSGKYPEVRAEAVDSKAYDYIVVGGGTAGCVLASRLSEDPHVSVLVLERGVANNTWMSRIPLISADILRPDYGAVNWDCEPMAHCEDRQAWVVRGEVLGGNSRINSMVYTRGGAAEYDAWSAMGHLEWSYEKVLPYFVKAETSLSTPESRYRGRTGPWINQTINHLEWPFKVCRVLRDCAITLGFPLISDINAPDAPRDGFTAFDLTWNNRQRVSTMHAFLSKEIVEKRPNLTICTGVVASRIAFSGDSKEHRAETVHFQYAKSKSHKIFSAKVKREVIICSGAVGSPQTLMLSGIGPREHLEEHGIEVIRDLPGVGSELTDHMAMPVSWEVPISESVNQIAISTFCAILEFLKYLLFRTGVLSIPFQPLSIFARSTALSSTSSLIPTKPVTKSAKKNAQLGIHDLDDAIPDIELMPLATTGSDNVKEHFALFSKIGMFTFLATVLQPQSRGTVRLASANALQRPKVDFGFLSAPADWIVARKAVRLALKFGDAIKAAGFPLLRGVCVPDGESDEEVDAFIRRRARTTYHYASSCRMGGEGDKVPGVVDDELRVHGCVNLRVCDASVFPRIIATHLQAPVVMVAEKCADMIKTTALKEW